MPVQKTLGTLSVLLCPSPSLCLQSAALLVSDSRQGFKLLTSGQFGPQKAFWVSPKVSGAPLSSGDVSTLEISRWRRERFGVK